MIYTIIASQNVKIPGQMVKFLETLDSWQVCNSICDRIWENRPNRRFDFFPEKASTKFKYCLRKI